ncbi:hypothetical protein [Mycolicibacter minnesotensis]
MRSNRVRPYGIATRCRTRSFTRHVPVGPRHEIVHSFDFASPFWPVTVDQDAHTLTGYGIDHGGACIRYTPNPHALFSRFDDVTIQRVQFAPGCHDLMRRATRANPAFICETLAHRQGVQLLRDYLVDAALSLAEGRGPLVVRPAPPRTATG